MSRRGSTLLGQVVLAISTLLVMSGCGGGGSSSSGTNNNGNSVGKATISGAVSFPSIGNLVAKRVGNMVPGTGVSIEVYDLEGKLVGSPLTPEYDDTATSDKRIYSYSFAGLDMGRDYVIKAKRNNVVLKKLIEKKDIVEKTVGQSVNPISTAAVIVASKQLGAVLGDVLPTGKTVAGLSALISSDIKPVLLESTINTVVNGGKSGVTDATMAAFANVYNIVVTAGSEDVNPSAMFTATPPTLTNTVPILSIAAGSAVATVTATIVTATNIAVTAAPVYVAPTETAALYTASAKSYLAKQDIANAALNYEKALSINPDDAEANFGGAITSGMMMMEDPDVKTIISKWGAVAPTVNQVVQGTSPVSLPFGNLTSIKLTPKTVAKSVGSTVPATSTKDVLAAFSALRAKLPQQKTGFKSLAKELGLVVTTAPTISEMQTMIENVIIPKVDKIIARLAKVEGTGFSFTVTKAMQGNPVYGTDVTYNDGEFYTLDAALNIFNVLFKMAVSYSFDIPVGYTYDTIGQDPLALINNVTLKSTGADRMSSALTNAQAAAAKATRAYNFVKARALGVGTFDIATWTALDKTNFEDGLTKVTGILAGQYTISINGGAKTVVIDATKFFTNPLTRAQLPTFGYDVPRDVILSAKYQEAVASEQTFGTAPYTWTNAVYSKIVPTSDFPDYTLNNILPNNTPANKLGDFTGILPKLDGKILSDIDFNLLYASNQRIYTGATKFYFGYNATNTATGVTNRAVYKLDTTTGIVTQYCTDVTGIPAGMIYQGISYYANPAGLYARLWNGVASTEFRSLTQNGTSCTIATTATNTVTLPTGKTSFTFENRGDNIDPLLHYTMFVAATLTTPSSNTFYSAIAPATALITLDNTKSLFQLRNGTIAVRSNTENLLEQYTIGADGITVTPSGSYINIDYLPNMLYGEKKMLVSGGGFYWLFDGVKMIKYAGKPNGTNF